MWELSSDMEKSHGQLETVISPLSFALALMFPTQSGFSVLTLIHAAEFTSAHTHFLPSSAEETWIIHLHINSNPPLHQLGCKKISCSTSIRPLDGAMELPPSTLMMMKRLHSDSEFLHCHCTVTQKKVNALKYRSLNKQTLNNKQYVQSFSIQQLLPELSYVKCECITRVHNSSWRRFNTVLETFLRFWSILTLAVAASVMQISRSSTSQSCSAGLRSGELCVMFKKPVWDNVSCVTWCFILLEVSVRRWVHCG